MNHNLKILLIPLVLSIAHLSYSFKFNYQFINQHRHHQFDPRMPPVPSGIQSSNQDLQNQRHSQDTRQSVKDYQNPVQYKSVKHGGLYQMVPPSILTMDEEYEGKQINFKRQTDLSGGGSSGSGESDADFVLPMCCNMEREEVISYHCRNTLGSGPEAIFKRKVWVAPKNIVSTRRSVKFKFVSSSLNCKYSKFSAKISLNRTSDRVPGGVTNPTNLALSSESQFSPDGYLKYKNEYYRPTEYCVSGLSSNTIEVQVCKVNCSDPLTPCLQKCCGLDQIYSFGYGDHPRGCVDVDQKGTKKWFPTLYHDMGNRLSNQEIVQLNPHIVHIFPTSFKYNCRFNKTTVFPHGKGIADFLTALTHKNFKNLEFHMRKDGYLIYPGKSGGSANEALAKRIENYCIDGAQDYGESSVYSNLEGETVLFLCSGGVDEAFDTKLAALKPPFDTSFFPKKTTETPKTTQTPLKPKPFSAEEDFAQLFEAFKKYGGSFQNPFKPKEQNNQPQPQQEISVTMGDSSSVEIEIDDNVGEASTEVENSVESDKFFSNENQNQQDKLDGGQPAQFIPEVLKIAVRVPQNPPVKIHPIPQPVSILPSKGVATVKKKISSQTSFSVNNFHQTFLHDEEEKEDEPPKYTIPTCCPFSSDVNDGFTHHCRNRRMADKLKDVNSTTGNALTGINGNDAPNAIPSVNPRWNVPPHFMTWNKSTSFTLKSQGVTCTQGKFQFQGFIHNFEQERAKSPGEKRNGILSDGWLKYDDEFYAPDHFCINGLSPRIVEILICKPDCSMWETPCVQKCCGLDEIYNLGLGSGNRGCQPLREGETKFSPKLYKNMDTPVPPEELGEIAPHFVQKYPPNFQENCFNKITLAFPFSKDIAEKLTPAESSERGGTGFKHLNFRFRKDGKLIYSYPEGDGTSSVSVYDRGEYCVDGVRDFGENERFSNHENQTILFICASEPHQLV